MMPNLTKLNPALVAEAEQALAAYEASRSWPTQRRRRDEGPRASFVLGRALRDARKQGLEGGRHRAAE